MTTRILTVSPHSPDPKAITAAVEVLKSGGLVSFPTETVYGLGADAFNTDAVRKIFEAKERPTDNPLIIHVADLRDVELFAKEIPLKARKLADRCWPGPLTLVLYGKNTVPDTVRAGLETVAARVPNHSVALAMLKEFGGGVVAPSANLSGRPSPTSAYHVLADLRGKVDMVLDAGPTEIGIESTVLDMTVDPPAILRQGGLTKDQIENVIGIIRVTAPKELLKRSPGTRHRHYAPRAKLILISSIQEIKTVKGGSGKIGLIYHSLDSSDLKHEYCRRLSRDTREFARSLFGAIRELDALGVDVILVERVEERGIGVAVMERLAKASQE